MTSTAWVLRWFCGEFSTCCSPDRPSAAVHGNERSVRIFFWTFSRSSADFWWKANHLMCRRASLRATASSLHVNDLNPFSVRGQMNQSDRCCGPHDAAVRAFCSVVTCLCQSLAPDIFAFLLWDSEMQMCAAQTVTETLCCFLADSLWSFSSVMNEPKRKTARSGWILADGRRIRLCSGSKNPVFDETQCLKHIYRLLKAELWVCGCWYKFHFKVFESHWKQFSLFSRASLTWVLLTIEASA